MSKKGQKEVIVIDKVKAESVFMVIFIVILSVIGFYLLINSINNVTNINSDQEILESINKNSYKDSDLNITLLYPSQWALMTMDEEVQGIKKKAISDVAGGNEFSVLAQKFNILEHRLEDEIVSVLMVNNPTEHGDGEHSYSQFVSVSFIGDMREMDNNEKLEFLQDRFLESIEASNTDLFTKVSILKSNQTPNGGFYIEAKGEFENGEIYYGQYSEVVGVNIATAIMGSRLEDDIYGKLSDIVGSIKTN